MSYESLKPGVLQDENIQIANWRKYSNSDNSILKYSLSANFGTRIAKSVIYLKNKENLDLEQFWKTYSKKTLKFAALNIASFLS